MKKSTRREFIAASAGTIALSAAIFRSTQGWFTQMGQLAGVGVERSMDRPLNPPRAGEIDPVSHALSRLTFGAGPGDHARVTEMGVQAFIEEQFEPEKIDDSLCDRATARFCDVGYEPLGEHYDEDAEALPPILRRVTLLRAIYSERQLFEVMCEFWSDHFNIDPGKGDCRWTKTTDDAEVIRKHALGNFRELLRASALSPAMLWYLDGRANVKRKPGDKPNENYARELMELHTLGVHGGYSQQDVMEVARCLTGWTIHARKDDGYAGALSSPLTDRAAVIFRREAHDDGAKHVLGREIPAGLGKGDLDRVIGIICGHASTARFIAHKLCVRFIADEPPQTAVDMVASAFTASSGDIRTTLLALSATPEFGASAGMKLKRPFHFIVSALRATNASTSADRTLLSYLERMGHMPFRWPTPDGYPAAAAHWRATLLWRWNFALALANNQIGGTSIQRARLQARIGSDVGLMATLLGRQPRAEESDAWLKSGDGLALMIASPAFQRC
ncbi:MAG: DUF1800 domain-containing protein [Chthoniobacteraceae bacterium]